jgi:hypothetical protein
MTTQTEVTQRNHQRAVRFFWYVLIGATLVSLNGNIAHAALSYIPHIIIQIGAAAVPPIALLADGLSMPVQRLGREQRRAGLPGAQESRGCPGHIPHGFRTDLHMHWSDGTPGRIRTCRAA